jgi:GNAT superfamily N-acetyltransferase
MVESGRERVLTTLAGLDICRISYAEILDAPNSWQLLGEYAAECSIPQIGMICPQREMYAAMEGSGLLHSFGAFQSGELVGFATLLIYVLPHYGRKIATPESIFVAKGHRAGTGRELMNAVEEYAKEQGCRAVLYSAPAGGQLEQLLDISNSYHRTNAVFCRSLQ